MIEMKIRDEEIEEIAGHIKGAGQVLNGRLEGLRNCLRNVCDTGVSEGDFHNNLEVYLSLLDSLLAQLDMMTVRCNFETMMYNMEIDRLDGDLYG